MDRLLYSRVDGDEVEEWADRHSRFDGDEAEEWIDGDEVEEWTDSYTHVLMAMR